MRPTPVILEDRPENLIEEPPWTLERAAGGPFLQRAALPAPRSPAVGGNRARFQAVYADHPERKIDHRPVQPREIAPAPERRANRKSPTSALPSRIELSDLKQAHRILVAIRHDGETETVPSMRSGVRFRDESSEPFHVRGSGDTTRRPLRWSSSPATPRRRHRGPLGA